MKITKARLAEIIKEELTKAQKQRKKKLEKELKDLEHKWMKEGKLSSALMERYGIKKENAVGQVLWHSLNENGEIGVYDMKFGNTVVRNLLAEDIEAIVEQDHKHDAQYEDDPKRGK